MNQFRWANLAFFVATRENDRHSNKDIDSVQVYPHRPMREITIDAITLLDNLLVNRVE